MATAPYLQPLFPKTVVGSLQPIPSSFILQPINIFNPVFCRPLPLITTFPIYNVPISPINPSLFPSGNISNTHYPLQPIISNPSNPILTNNSEPINTFAIKASQPL
jgi:hypothetical protein